MEIETLRRKNGEALYKTSPKSDVEPLRQTEILTQWLIPVLSVRS